MPKLNVDIVTAERLVYSEQDVDDDQQKGVERRIANQKGSMAVEGDATGRSVVVIDDLYGSGASMCEAARVLRDAGAAEVLGLTVTKQRLYEGIRLATLD